MLIGQSFFVTPSTPSHQHPLAERLGCAQLNSNGDDDDNDEKKKKMAESAIIVFCEMFSPRPVSKTLAEVTMVQYEITFTAVKLDGVKVQVSHE